VLVYQKAERSPEHRVDDEVGAVRRAYECFAVSLLLSTIESQSVCQYREIHLYEI
jgi:hypothetical protein